MTSTPDRSDQDDLYVSPVVAADQVDPSQSLTGSDLDDPLDAGYSPPDREPTAWEGATAEETLQGESLDRKLAEEEPDVTELDTVAADEQPRAGRLVAPDEGAHPTVENEEIASDVGRDGQVASAEEAAVHIEEDV